MCRNPYILLSRSYHGKIYLTTPKLIHSNSRAPILTSVVTSSSLKFKQANKQTSRHAQLEICTEEEDQFEMSTFHIVLYIHN